MSACDCRNENHRSESSIWWRGRTYMDFFSNTCYKSNDYVLHIFIMIVRIKWLRIWLRRKNIAALTIDHIRDRGIYLNILLKDSPFNSLQNTM